MPGLPAFEQNWSEDKAASPAGLTGGGVGVQGCQVCLRLSKIGVRIKAASPSGLNAAAVAATGILGLPVQKHLEQGERLYLD